MWMKVDKNGTHFPLLPFILTPPFNLFCSTFQLPSPTAFKDPPLKCLFGNEEYSCLSTSFIW